MEDGRAASRTKAPAAGLTPGAYLTKYPGHDVEAGR
jgi:hypothetical protein